MKKWNWQQPDWPQFAWSAERLTKAEEQFLVQGGMILGAVNHLTSEDRAQLTVQAISDEAVTSSEIEGEFLDRESVQSSIRRQLGFVPTDVHPVSPAEQGMAEMMVSLYQQSEKPLDKPTLCRWHQMLMSGRRDLRSIGCYREHTQPMKVVSGRVGDAKVYFEAPPSPQVPAEMAEFIAWFNRTAPDGDQPLPALTRAGTAHLYFESIHPFEDGNGRIGRAISEKILAQCLGRPTLTMLAATILIRRHSYYEMLERSNQRTDINHWLAWFAAITLEAQQRTQAQVEFLIDKTKLLDRLRPDLNQRQLAVLLRVLREGPEGFKGGLSAGNYITIAKTSPATARRDLADLVDKGAFIRVGERRHARYNLTIPLRPVAALKLDEAGNVLTVLT